MKTELPKPVRIQLSRRKGFRLQEISRTLNGLPAVAVGRGRHNKWGNPWKVGRDGDAEFCVWKYRVWLASLEVKQADIKRELRGKNLACWCSGSPCHADVLLEIANT